MRRSISRPCRLAAHHFTDVAAAFRDVRRVLRPGGRFVLVDNYAPDDPTLDTVHQRGREAARCFPRAQPHNRRVARAARGCGLRTSVESDLMTTKITTEGWLERSQTPADRADEVRRRLRDASAAARDAFQITDTRSRYRRSSSSRRGRHDRQPLRADVDGDPGAPV
jgi:SAM-dependent methyltransferase